MIGAPPVLTLKRQFSRPSAAQLEAFADVPTGFVVDALAGRGALDQSLYSTRQSSLPLRGS